MCMCLCSTSVCGTQAAGWSPVSYRYVMPALVLCLMNQSNRRAIKITTHKWTIQLTAVCKMLSFLLSVGKMSCILLMLRDGQSPEGGNSHSTFKKLKVRMAKHINLSWAPFAADAPSQLLPVMTSCCDWLFPRRKWASSKVAFFCPLPAPFKTLPPPCLDILTSLD